MRSQLQKILIGLQALLIVAPVILVSLSQTTSAAPLNTRLVLLSTSVPSAQAAHTFSFDIATAGSLGSVEFEYCSNDPFVGAPCTTPIGLNVAAAILAGESGETGFSVDNTNTTANRLVITRPSSPATPQTSTYTFDGVTNPSTPKQTIYVRISTFISIDATGPRTDDGSVAFSTSGSLSVGGYVPPYLTFCVGVTVSPNCSSVGSANLNLGELSKVSPITATSQFAGATNDVTGFFTSLAGSTMTSGNNIINPLPAPTSSQPGSSQFGLNMRANTNPSVGQDPIGSGTSNIMPDFNTPNKFVLKSDTVASSPIPTEFNVITVTYIVNVASNQSPGIYSTTLTYIATASF